jgi:hypothetical protein
MMLKTINSALVLSTAMAAPTAWNGVWNDPMYGGNIQVCVSLVSGVYYGQATISDTGYMRGTIDFATDTWTGNFYLQGIEAQRGTFSFAMTTGEFVAELLMHIMRVMSSQAFASPTHFFLSHIHPSPKPTF